MTDRAQVAQVKEMYKGTILTKPNVVGVGVAYKESGGRRTDELSVVALVREKIPAARLAPEELVPQEVGGIRTDVVQVGELRALTERTDRWRPAPAGVSLGHFQITAGTLGCVVRDRTTSKRLILSNNHVMANSNDAALGDAILQPGPADGGNEVEDTIAILERFCPIEFNVAPPTCSLARGAASLANGVARLLGSKHRLEAIKVDAEASNLVDAAAALPLADDSILDEILEIGVVDGTTPATLGMAVRKSGRTTGLTEGEITILNATVTVGYGSGRSALFEDQIITGAMSAGGDSGSLLVAGDSLAAVGLLFAGSDQTTVHNPIQAVMDCLGVDF